MIYLWLHQLDSCMYVCYIRFTQRFTFGNKISSSNWNLLECLEGSLCLWLMWVEHVFVPSVWGLRKVVWSFVNKHEVNNWSQRNNAWSYEFLVSCAPILATQFKIERLINTHDVELSVKDRTIIRFAATITTVGLSFVSTRYVGVGFQ